MDVEYSPKTIASPHGPLLRVSSKMIDKCIEYLSLNREVGVEISIGNGYYESDLSWLTHCPWLTTLRLESARDFPAEDILVLRELRNLSFGNTGFADGFDYSRFPRLEYVEIRWGQAVARDIDCGRLNVPSLYLVNYRHKSRDFYPLSGMDKLREMVVHATNVVSTSGISRLTQIKKLWLMYPRKLVDIKEIGECKSIEDLRIDDVKSVRNVTDVIQNLTNLVHLSISDISAIDSLRFVRKLPNLRTIAFVGTRVLDGDISPCLHLDHVGFTDRKGYSHTYREVLRLIRSRSTLKR